MHLLKKAVLVAAIFAPLALFGASAEARNYDCSKPGNANKTACKTPVTNVPAPKPAPAVKSTVAAKPAVAATAERHYDCAKAGNANKAVCKGTVNAPSVKPAPVATAAPAAPAKSHWWSKSSPAPVAAPPAAARAPAPTATPTVTTNAAGPQGATAQCKDGSYSHAVHHSGACSHHGGVAKWF